MYVFGISRGAIAPFFTKGKKKEERKKEEGGGGKRRRGGEKYKLIHFSER